MNPKQKGDSILFITASDVAIAVADALFVANGALLDFELSRHTREFIAVLLTVVRSIVLYRTGSTRSWYF